MGSPTRPLVRKCFKQKQTSLTVASLLSRWPGSIETRFTRLYRFEEYPLLLRSNRTHKDNDQSRFDNNF